MSIKTGTTDITAIYMWNGTSSRLVKSVYNGSEKIFPPLARGTVDILIVGGGGGSIGGGADTYQNSIGGGGAGGMVERFDEKLQADRSYDIIVGAGGDGSGNPSKFGTWEALKGGGVMTNGGSGGGEVGTKNQASGALGAGKGTAGQGHDGGLGEGTPDQTAAGGGGGAGAKGVNAQTVVGLAIAGHGGNSKISSIKGHSSTSYCGGGGGGASTLDGASNQSSNTGYGGGGGAGDGGIDGGIGENAQPNTGSGAGGGGWAGVTLPRRYGGSGIVVVTSHAAAVRSTGAPQYTTSAGRHVYIFKGSGSITF
jgi:hypothetical protein